MLSQVLQLATPTRFSLLNATIMLRLAAMPLAAVLLLMHLPGQATAVQGGVCETDADCSATPTACRGAETCSGDKVCDGPPKPARDPCDDGRPETTSDVCGGKPDDRYDDKYPAAGTPGECFGYVSVPSDAGRYAPWLAPYDYCGPGNVEWRTLSDKDGVPQVMAGGCATETRCTAVGGIWSEGQENGEQWQKVSARAPPGRCCRCRCCRCCTRRWIGVAQGDARSEAAHPQACTCVALASSSACM